VGAALACVAAPGRASPLEPLVVETVIDRSAYSWFGRITVMAAVTDQGAPVTDCDSVIATSSVHPEVRAYLEDDGVAPDLVPGDGLYAGHFEIGGANGEARPTGSYTVVAVAYREGATGSDTSPAYSLYTVRRWSGITTSAVPDIDDDYTTLAVTSNGPGAGWHHVIGDLGLVRSSIVTDARIRLPILPRANTVSNLSVTGSGVSNVELAGNVIAFDCDLTTASVVRVTLEFDAPSDLAATFIDRYHTGDMGRRDFRNGYLVWNRFIHTGILGSDYSSPHGPGCIVDLHATDLETGAAHTVDCMERVAVHLDDTPRNDGTGTYPSNVKWTGDAVDWLTAADLDAMTFVFHSGGSYGLADELAITKTVTFRTASRMFRHEYQIENTDVASHDLDLVWGREQWLYGSAPGSDRQDDDRGLLPNDAAAHGGEHGFAAGDVDGNWFAAFDATSYYSIGVVLDDRTPEAMPTYAYFLCDPPLGNFTGEYPIVPAGSCTDMPNLFFEKQIGVVPPGGMASYAFYQWGGYGIDRVELVDLLWRDAVSVSGEPLAVRFSPLGDQVPVETAIDIWFTNPMDHATTETAVSITPAVPGGGGFEWLESDRRLRFWPAGALEPATIYEVEVDRGATDQQGVHLATAGRWYFETATGTTTAPLADASPRAVVLAGAAPNPFAASTDIAFSMPEAAHVRMTVYNVQGQMVRVLRDGRLPAGRHAVTWQGDDLVGRRLAAGVYFCRLDIGTAHEVCKVVVGR
jgi:hypothetical protein